MKTRRCAKQAKAAAWKKIMKAKQSVTRTNKNLSKHRATVEVNSGLEV